MSEVTQEDYDAIEYVKPAGEMLFRAALVNGFPSRYRPDVVLVEAIDENSLPIQFVGVFSNSGFKTQIFPAFGALAILSTYEHDVFVEHYRERRMLYQQGWADWLATIRVGDYYVVHGRRRRLQAISMVTAPKVENVENPVYAFLRFGPEEKLNVVEKEIKID